MFGKFLTFAGLMALLGAVVGGGLIVIPVLFGAWGFAGKVPGEPTFIAHSNGYVYIKTTDNLFHSCKPSQQTCKSIDIQSFPGIEHLFTDPISVNSPCEFDYLPTSFPDGNIAATHIERRCGSSSRSDIYVIGMEDGSIWSYGPSMFSGFDVLFFGFLGYIGGLVVSIPLFVIWAIFRLFRPRMKAKNDTKHASVG